MKNIVFTLLFIFVSLIPAAPIIKKGSVNILVYPFDSGKGGSHSWIASGLTDTVITDLGRVKGVYVFSDSDRRKAIQEISLGMTGLVKESDVVRTGQIIGANVIFTGGVQVSGTRVRVTARLIDVETSKTEKSVKLDGTVENIFDLQDKVVLSLVSETGEAVSEGLALKKPSAAAYELYSKGVEVNDTDPKRALEFYLKALAVQPDYLDAMIKAGSVYDDLKKFDEALEYLEKARDILDRMNAGETARYSEVLNNLGIVFRDMGDHEKAVEFYSKAQNIRHKLGLGNTVNYAETQSNIGIVYVDTGKYDRALEYYLDALKIMESLNFTNSSKYAVLLNNIGGVYWSRRDNETALRYYLMSQQIRDKLGLQQTAGYAYLMNNIGGIYWRRGDNKQAILYYVKSQEIRDWLGLQNTESYSTLMSNIALTYYKRLNDPCRGVEYIRKCVEIDRKNGFLKLSSDMNDYNEIVEACGKKK